jgi:hypothetical protein
LEQLLGQPLVSKTRIWDHPTEGFHCDIVGYELAGPVDVTDRACARSLIAVALQPAPPQLIVRELARLRMLTKAKAEAGVDLEAMFSVLAEELAVFPADIVCSVLRRLGRTSKFFPSLAEVYQACEDAVKPRRLLADTLNGFPRDDRSR